MIINLVTEFRVSIFEQFLPERGAAPLDAAVTRVLIVAVEAKAFIVFSFLFGMGLAVQRSRSLAPIARRLGALLVIGAVHLVLVWNGDILTEYAVLGLVALPLPGRPAWALFAAAAALFVVHALPLPLPAPLPSLEAMEAHIRAARHAYGEGGASEVLAFRVRELAPIGALLVWVAPRTLGLMLLGAGAWKARVIQRSRAHGAAFAIASAVAIPVGLAATWITTATDGAAASLPRPIRMLAEAWGPVVLALGYAAAALACLTRPRGRAWLSHFAPLGRMALTSYLTQSVLFGFVFYGYGLGLFGRVGAARTALWRSFTYGAWQPMRIDRD